MKNWIITIAAVLVVCLLLCFLSYAEFGSYNFIRVGLALTNVMGTDSVYPISDVPERAWLVGTRGGLEAFGAYLEAEGWTLRTDQQMGARIPVEKDGRWDYVHWSVNGMYHKFTWQTAGDPARAADAAEPADLSYPGSAAHAAYFYPGTNTSLTVRPAGTVTFAYPACDDLWQLDARPDGSFSLGLEHHRLQWESRTGEGFSLEEGFCVAGADTAAFLEDALAKLGLTRREADDFLLHFLPQLEGNAWNLITFHDHSGAEISPAPDSSIHVFMVWKALDEPMELTPQNLTAPERTGFTAVQWGGAMVE